LRLYPWIIMTCVVMSKSDNCWISYAGTMK